MSIVMEPIGVAHTDAESIPRHWSVSNVKGTLVIDEKYREGLKNIETGQRVEVIFYFHKSPAFSPEFLSQQPPTRNEKRGIFSTCSPMRPNPVGLSVLEVLGVEGNVLHVQGLDMLDGTPILDIKPLKKEWHGHPGYTEEIAMTRSEWIDISVPFPVDKPMPYFPTDPRGPSITRIFDRTQGDPVTMSQININSHNGTHIDAPFHFMAEGTTIDMMPLDTAIGPARVIEIKDPERITLEEVAPYDIQAGERILFKTRNSSYAYRTTDFITDYVYCTNEVAYYLKDKKIRLVGIDYVTIGSQKDLENIKTVHETLLGNGIYIMEMLNLDGVAPGNYEMICLPLRMEKGDAGPCRAIIRPMG